MYVGRATNILNQCHVFQKFHCRKISAPSFGSTLRNTSKNSADSTPLPQASNAETEAATLPSNPGVEDEDLVPNCNCSPPVLPDLSTVSRIK